MSNISRLANILLGRESQKEMIQVLKSIATDSEIEKMAQRIKIVLLLSQGKSYRQIANKLSVSTRTVVNVGKRLKNVIKYPYSSPTKNATTLPARGSQRSRNQRSACCNS